MNPRARVRQWTVLVSLLLAAGCSQSPTSEPYYRLEVLNPLIWEAYSRERTPPPFDPDVVYHAPAGWITHDLWANGHPDVAVPMLKAYKTGLDTRMHMLFFKNTDGILQEASSELVGEQPFIPGFRQSVSFARPNDAISGIFGVQHDTGDGGFPEAVLIAAGERPINDTAERIATLPLPEKRGSTHAVDAHALAAGDIRGIGRTDILVGESSALDDDIPSYWLIQNDDGFWQVSYDEFLFELTYPGLTGHATVEHTALLSLHIADVTGDGYDDLIAGYGHGDMQSRLFFNQGDGTFSFDASVELPLSVYGLENALHMKTWSFDMNGNGSLDLLNVYTRDNPYYEGYAFQVLINDGSGYFTDESDTWWSYLDGLDPVFERSWSENFYVLDVNGDGWLDVIGSDLLHWHNVRLWINDNGTRFVPTPVQLDNRYDWGVHSFFEQSDGSISSVVYLTRAIELDSEGYSTEARYWFEQTRLVDDSNRR